MRHLVLITALLLVGAGCSDKTDMTTQQKTKKDHVWKSQTQVMERAKGIESTVIDSAKTKQKEIEQQTK